MSLMLISKPCLAFILLFTVAAAALAQSAAEAGAEPVAGTLETVTVNARRSIEQRFFAPGSLVVVDRADIENLGAFSVADVLRQLPGVAVTTGADGGVEIRMRGMDRNATQLLVDGQRSATGRGQLALDQLPPEMVERIEVLRSPSPEFSGATGGTINIVLRQATVRRETVLRLTDHIAHGRHAGQAYFSRTGPVGGPAAAPAGEQGGAAAPPWAYFVAVSAASWLPGSDVLRTVSGPSGSSVTEAASRYRRQDLTLVPRLTGRLGSADTLTLRGVFSRSDFGGHYDADSRSSTGVPSRSTERQDREREYLQGAADWTHRFRRTRMETTLATSRVRETLDRLGQGIDPVSGAAMGANTFAEDRPEDVHTLRTKLTGTSDALLWSGGAELERRSLQVDTVSGGAATAATAVIDRRVLWGQNEWEVLDGATLTAGLRAESIQTGTTINGAAGEWQNSFLQPSVHLRKPVGDALQWRANLARTTRNPRVWDLVDRNVPSQGANSISNPDSAGNPQLRPERSLALDTGFERRIEGGGVMGVNLFVREVDDAFATRIDEVAGRWVEQRVNIGSARVWGIEADHKGNLRWLGLGREWNLSANASLLQSRMTSGPTRGERIPGQPRYTASVTVTRPMRPGFFGGGTLTLTGASDLNTSPGLTGREDARAALDLHVGQVLPGLGYWRAGVQNVADTATRRERRSVDPSTGAVTASTSELRPGPRVFLTAGTRF